MRGDLRRLEDIDAAIGAIAAHMRRGGLEDDLVFDAVRVRLIEIGEAVKDVDPSFLARERSVPWTDVARMRDHLAHRYFDTDHLIVGATVKHDLPPRRDAVRRLIEIEKSDTDMASGLDSWDRDEERG